MEKYQELVAFALAQPGVADVRLIGADEIVFDPRTILKCMYGCADWSNRWVCPSAPGGLRPWEAEPIFRRYQAVILVHTHDAIAAQNASLALGCLRHRPPFGTAASAARPRRRGAELVFLCLPRVTPTAGLTLRTAPYGAGIG